MYYKYIGTKVLLFFAVGILLNSCNDLSSQKAQKKSSEEIINLREEIVKLSHSFSSKIEELQGEIDTLDANINEFDTNRMIDSVTFVACEDFDKFIEKSKEELLELRLGIVESTTILNLKEKGGYATISANGHLFCVSVENVQPYLDGFKVIFKIGNPLSATYQNPKVNLKWSKTFWKYYQEQKESKKGVTDIIDLWTKSGKKSEQTVLKSLQPGVWNKVELLLTPATLDEIERVEFSMEIDTLSFYNETCSS